MGSDKLQIDLLNFLKIKFSGYNRISTERVVSGTGICNIYDFLSYNSPEKVDPEMHGEYSKSPGQTAIITKYAKEGSLCKQALDIFMSCYGAQCGAFAITVMPFRGLFITGGVSKRLAQQLKEPKGEFLRAYGDKGRVTPILEQVPILLVKSDDMGQRGAHLRSVRLLLEVRSGVEARLVKG